MKKCAHLFLCFVLLLTIEAFSQSKQAKKSIRKKSTTTKKVTVDNQVCGKPAEVVDLILSANQITKACFSGSNCNSAADIIEVNTKSLEPDEDNYIYDVSAGKVLGKGSNVSWDLSGLPPGTYIITAGINVEKWGKVLGKTVTKKVVITHEPLSFKPSSDYLGGLFQMELTRQKPKPRQTEANEWANVTNVLLNKDAIDINCPGVSKSIEVTANATDKEGDVLVYNYTISAGKITGSGPKVIWDLTNIKPGEYTITAAVDDGCGFCGKTMTKTVKIVSQLECK